MKKTGYQAVVACLKEQNVDVVFGYPGAQTLFIYDALYEEPSIRHILTAHEQGATHAADGYARATGKVGVVITTSGPGATNAITGIATAQMDSSPMVVITGQVPCNMIGRDTFQEVDVYGITTPITKHNYIVKDPASLPRIIREAFTIARTGRPGVVVVDIPKDVQSAEIEYVAETIDTSYENKDLFHPGLYDQEAQKTAINEAVEALNSCEKPFILAGGGVNISGAAAELMQLADMLHAPVSCSLMGLGAFPGDHPNYMGIMGMHGSKYANHAAQQCDLFLAVGARFSDRVTGDVNAFAPNAKIVHIDIDLAELNKNVRADIAICGDVKNTLKAILADLKPKKNTAWLKSVHAIKEQYPLKYPAHDHVNPQYVLQELDRLTGGDVIITTEVGQNQMWAAQYFRVKNPRSFISSGGLGTMGFGLGASVGASIGRPGTRVVNIAGDGSFMMNSNELATVSRYQVPIIQLVFNNHALGMVRQWQNLFFDQRFSQTVLGGEVDFVKLADAYGIPAYRINTNDQAGEILEKALAVDGPVLVECRVHPDDMVTPMVMLGKGIDIQLKVE
jgi:acetolactate synthase-1/2/3 large subunit